MLVARHRRGQMMRSLNRGFTLIELLVTMTILAFCLCGLLATYINLAFLTDLSRDTSLATNACLAKIEEIKNANFDCLSETACVSCSGSCLSCFCNQSTFALPGIAQGVGKIEIGMVSGYTNLKTVRVVACFRSRNRLIGNDLNNCQTSPVEVDTLVAQ